jgi:hypothetical protein
MRPRAIPILAVVSVLLLALGSSRAQDAQPSEYQLKAAFLFNFAKFVEWPPEVFSEPAAPIVIGIIGENPFGKDLEDIVRDKKINARALIIKPIVSLDDGKKCHLLFISTSEKNRLPEIFQVLGKASVLTVGETDQFTQNGGVINFVREGNKIRFEISDDAAKRAGLKISSKLLNLAVRSPR